MSTGTVAAVDLGATSGRVMIGHVDDRTLALEQVARFANVPTTLADGLHWDVVGLYRHALTGLREAVRRAPETTSIGIDSWAVDYGLLRDGRLLGIPFHYRDRRCEPGVDAVHARMPHPALYERNGLQFLPFNTLYQWAAEPPEVLALADTALLIPDLLGYWLTGLARAERTNASTTGLLRQGEWDDRLCAELGLPRGILPTLISPGEHLGPLTTAASDEVGARLPVVAVGSHDTASAVAAVPMGDPTRAAYISCGTWGLVGVELSAPVTGDEARQAGFTNEGGIGGRIRFLHNVTGLWLLNESIRVWEAQEGTPIDLPALLEAAGAVTGEVAVFDANDADLASPGDMPAQIAAVLARDGRRVPTTRAGMTRSIIESIAAAFAEAVHRAAGLTGLDLEVIHMVGGGALNTLLCQSTADRAGLPVLAGPVEATALGNVLVQARTAGLVTGSWESVRALVARTQEPRRFEPR